MPGAGRKIKQKSKDEEGEEVAEEVEEEERIEVVEEEVQPIMYRWISSKKGDGASANMTLSFSVPPAALPTPPPESSPESEVLKPKGPSNCAVEGCGQPRKYRLVKDWTIGACGMAHLKVLEG